MILFFIIALMLLSITCLIAVIFCETYNAIANVMGICGICIIIAFVIYMAFFHDNKEKQSIADRYEQLVNLPPSLESRADNLRKCMEKCTGQKGFHDVERAIEIVEDFEKDCKMKIDI